MWKCCCKKGSPKRDESAPVAVYYHVSTSNEHAGQLFIMCVFDFYFKFSFRLQDPAQPAYTSYSAAPAVNPPASSQPAATSVGPSVGGI